MNFGIVTYIAPDKSHGYLLKLDRLDKTIAFINRSLAGGAKPADYYKNLFAVICHVISESNICVFDLEYDGYNINEIAFSIDNKIISATSKDEIEILLPQLQETLHQPNSFLAGHNIVKFDMPLLKEKVELPQNIAVIDTIHIETLLSPTLKCFALDAKVR